LTGEALLLSTSFAIVIPGKGVTKRNLILPGYAAAWGKNLGSDLFPACQGRVIRDDFFPSAKREKSRNPA
jgi:hypothetical protein